MPQTPVEIAGGPIGSLRQCAETRGVRLAARLFNIKRTHFRIDGQNPYSLNLSHYASLKADIPLKQTGNPS